MKSKVAYLMVSVFFVSCIEQIDLATETEFESALVIEATITDELKKQQIVLSKTFRLEEEGPSPESFASVRLVTGNGDFIIFQEEGEPGVYFSENEFAAEPNLDYHLEITTSDGKDYGSTITQLTAHTQIDDLYLERGLNENDEEGISIFIDSFDPTGNSKLYRYTYEETYKIIAPFYQSLDLVVVEFIFPNCPIFEFQLKEEPQQICYNTVNSKEIILENTNKFEEDRIDRFRVRFISRNNYIMSHRYSIMVRQYTQSNEAFIYYEALRDLSSSESLLSQTQPGFFEGNVFSMSNSKEKVIGFFEVSSVDSRRIYFNYEDEFPGEFLPPYYINCSLFSPENCTPGGSPLANHLERGDKWFQNNPSPEPFSGTYNLVQAPCGDCRVLGSTTPPDFWIE